MLGQPSELIQIVQRGMACQQAGKLDAAEALYKQALAVDANQFEALHFYGVLQAQRGNLIEAERLVSRSLTLNAQRAEAHLNHARILRDLQRPEATIETCNTALRLNPNLVAASVLLGNALCDLARYDAALAAYERAIALRPDYHDAIYNRSLLQLARAQFDRAGPASTIASRFPSKLCTALSSTAASGRANHCQRRASSYMRSRATTTRS
jgi:tetratricopeptide (TPR) repeat protein